MAHTQFKMALTQDLHSRLKTTIKSRAGPSFDERLAKAVKDRTTKANAIEAEQRKTIDAAVEKGRGRAMTEWDLLAPLRRERIEERHPSGLSPEQFAMLEERQKQMKKQSADYNADIEALRLRMDNRVPLFRTGDVQDAFAQLEQRKQERRMQLQEEERQTWENIRNIEKGAHKRPLLIENPTYKAPIKHVEVKAPADGKSAPGAPGLKLESFACDSRIRDAVNSRSFKLSDWGKKVAQIQERADNRVPLHELKYPVKKHVNGLNGTMMCFNLKFD